MNKVIVILVVSTLLVLIFAGAIVGTALYAAYNYVNQPQILTSPISSGIGEIRGCEVRQIVFANEDPTRYEYQIALDYVMKLPGCSLVYYCYPTDNIVICPVPQLHIGTSR